MANTSVIILAAGEGKRMRSALPKVAHAVGGWPMLCHPVANALAVEADPVIVVVGVGRETVEAAVVARFPEAAARIRFAHQTVQAGTADAVASALPQLGEHADAVLILYGDVPNLSLATLRRLLAARDEADVPLALVTFRVDDPSGYGRIVRAADGRVLRIVEDRDCTEEERALTECNAGIYSVDRALLERGLAGIGRDNAQGELYLTDLVAAAVAQGGAVAIDADPEEVAGVNDRRELARANQVYRARRNDALMADGVTLIDPATTYVDAGVRVEPDVVLHPGVVLQGATVVEASSEVLAYSVLEDAHVGQGCKVGPFARLRPGARLKRGAKVGNYVEVKKSVLGVGAKASHLTYLGDATIGDRVNVGAGTITCNYDGEAKHRTVVGDGAFIGSDVQLVAPVSVGDGAYVGAGTTVTRDVPPGALALTRVAQQHIEGYAARRSARSKKRGS